MEVKPLKKNILVAENKKEKETASGIVLTDGARGIGDTTKATVLAIGDEVIDVKVGDVVLLDWAKASPVKVGEAQRAMIKEEFVIAIVEND